MKINKIIETVLYCDDVEEMLVFYQNLFDFEILQKSLPRGVFLKCGESVLAIFNRSMTREGNQVAPAHGATGVQHMAFEVPDGEYEEWKKIFTEKGIEIIQEVEWESRNNGAKSFYFIDPAGNNIELSEKKLWDSKGFNF
jgi:catechol 2,3-dioxygenase-like lactoylglutathione lyase family enzyme